MYGMSGIITLVKEISLKKFLGKSSDVAVLTLSDRKFYAAGLTAEKERSWNFALDL